MVISTILLIIGFIILIKGADIFVDGASGIATHFRVSKMLIGLTIVAFGTSAPELAVSIKAIISHSGDIVLGNVIGSNILNIFLILGVSAMVHVLNVKNNTVKKEIPILVLFTLLFSVLLSDNLFDIGIKNSFTRSDGVILLLFFCIFVYYLITLMRNKIDNKEEENSLKIGRAIIYTILGLIGIVLGSNFVVDSAVDIATILGVSQRLISLTIIALGTSLPELVTSVVSTRKGEFDIAIGNVVGSNIFNIGIVIGIPIALFGEIGTINFNYIDLITMIIATIFLFIFSRDDYKISKREGFMFLIIFIVYYSYILFI